ncbi:hypothetical protein PZ61_0231720 [Streptomyces sp. MNU77]|uniref:hypothetical protein n=1 Tax=Streptomyces sp. MNU77 TaxID=1573406 RepID=UPI0005E65EA8|nr:hypothetical protein [Streptomyces sp. MNU77]OLO34625.1 hypothetical protein PZ61_0231720 [Streptomyces sp. MNU77]
MARTFSAEDAAIRRQLHADGVNRNGIARQMGWSVGTITNHAQHLGLSFDREGCGPTVIAGAGRRGA